jgi:hypothetical protein
MRSLIRRLYAWFGGAKLERVKYRMIPVVECPGMYTFDSPRTMPTKRFLAMVDATNEMEVGISRNGLRAFAKGMAREIENKDWPRAAYYVQLLDIFLDQFTSPEVMFKVIDSCCILEGELATKFDPVWSKKKRKLFDSDEEARKFFFIETCRLLKQLIPSWTDLKTEQVQKEVMEAMAESTFLLRATHGNTFQESGGP